MKYSRFRWYVMLTMLYAKVAQSVVMIAPSPLMGEIAKTLGVSLGTATAAIMALFNLSLAFGSIAGGVIIDKIGLARSYIASLLFLCVASLLVPVVGNNLHILMLIRIIQGLATGPIVASVSKLAAEWFPVHERAMVSGFSELSLSLGVAIGFTVSPEIFALTSSWYASLAIGSFFCLIALVFATMMSFGPKQRGVAVKTITNLNIKRIIFLPITRTCIFAMILNSWIFSAFNDLTPAYLAVPFPSGLGKGPVVAGHSMMIFQLAFMVGAFSSGFFVEKVFRGKERPVLSIALMLTAFFTFSIKLPFVYTNMDTLIRCLLLAGLFMGMSLPTIFGFISKHYPEEVTGKIGGLAMGIGLLGGTVGVLVGSVALHITGNYQLSILIVSVMAAIGSMNARNLKARTY